MYANADCTGAPSDTITAAFGECKNPRDGYSSKAVSCADGEVVAHTFTTNDCTTVVDVQTVPVTGECCDSEGNCQASASQAPSGAVAVTVETTVTLKATKDGTFDDAAVVAALAEDLGVDAERITLVPSFDGTLEAGAEAEVKVVVEVEDGSSANVAAKLGELVCETDDCAETDVFGESFAVEAVAAIVIAAAVPPSPPPPSLVSGESQQQAGDVNVLSIVVIVVPVVLVVVIAVLIGVVLYLCCCKGKRATKAPEVEVKMSSTAV